MLHHAHLAASKIYCVTHHKLRHFLDELGSGYLSLKKQKSTFSKVNQKLKGIPGYKNWLNLIDIQRLVKWNGATFIFVEKLGSKCLPVQFWPDLCFASLSVTSGILPLVVISDLVEPKLRPLY